MKIAITGHRPNKLNNEYNLDGPCTCFLHKEINKILDRENPTHLITGMALGVDTLFALIGIERKIPILAYIPCRGQERMWPQRSKDKYQEILGNPLVRQILVDPGDYAPWKMQKRNKAMVNDCDKLIACWNGTNGGTANCVNYAKEVGKTIFRIHPTYELLSNN
jgi:uncharacterized phage-like protein YoqJ